MADIQHKRGLKSAFEALASTSGLRPGQIYILTDTKQMAVAITTSTYDLYVRANEQGIVVSTVAPVSPYLNQLWFDTN